MMPVATPSGVDLCRSASAVTIDDQPYDRNGSKPSYAMTQAGTFYDQSPGIRADLDRFNSGMLYGINLVGNSYCRV